MTRFAEDTVEQAALAWLESIGWTVRHGPDLAYGQPAAERTDPQYRDVILAQRLCDAVGRLNPDASSEAIDDAVRQLQRLSRPSLIQTNLAAHTLLVEGVSVDILVAGEVVGERLVLVDWDEPANNDWLAVNQFTVVGLDERRPDIVLFLNGLPVAGIELKNTGDRKADVDTAFKQYQTYFRQIPALYAFNELLVISDGSTTQVGALYTPRERFLAWKTIDGDRIDLQASSLEIAIRGIFDHNRILDLIRSFVVFEVDQDSGVIVKKVAQYHQFHAVQKAVARARTAVSLSLDDTRHGQGGVLWHTQGSGKSLTMLFFAGKLVRALGNPTLVMLTDRNDLDDQLYGTFSRGSHLLRQDPVQAEDRVHLRQLLRVKTGGVVFTTIQKFLPDVGQESYPLLSERRDIVVMADEAHRSQYSFRADLTKSGSFAKGFAQHMRDALPNATFVAFTGTPLEQAERDTRLVFGDYIDVYDFGRAIRDGATVPIYFESRLVDVVMADGQSATIDDEFEEVTETQEVEGKAKTMSRWTQLERVVGIPKRIAQVADDLVAHIEARQAANPGKVMVVGMSRAICVDLFDALAERRPEWADEDDAVGKMKVIMTGNATDDDEWQVHIRNKRRREWMADRFKDPVDPFQIAIVRDMWLTGFDAPCLHTIYIDKPMRGHGLMQTIARVNRVFGDKPGGLVVDYIGIADNLKRALGEYMRDGEGTDAPVANLNDQITIEESRDALVAQLVERVEIMRAIFSGFEYGLFLSGAPTERLQVVAEAEEFLYVQDGKSRRQLIPRFLDNGAALKKAYMLASATPEAKRLRPELAFFFTVYSAVQKTTSPDARSDDQIDHALRQLVDRAVAPQGVVDVFAVAGLERPDISVLSDVFLEQIRALPQQNLAVELLKKLLNDEIHARGRGNVVQQRRFSDKLAETVRRYQNRAVETAQIIEALIALAAELNQDAARGTDLGLTEKELAFYDALGTNDSAVKLLGDEVLAAIAREVADIVRRNATIDWTSREQVRANLRRLVKRTLRKHDYPPDKTEAATDTVIEQAELIARQDAEAA